MLDNLWDWKRSDACAALGAADEGREVILTGWVHRRRDHGGLVFMDLRDRSGLCQVVVDGEAESLRESLRPVRSEWVLAVRGTVRLRPADMRNAELPSGDVEVLVAELRVLNSSLTPPFPIDSFQESEVSDDLRLKYRYLDLRRREMLARMEFRHRVTLAVREFLSGEGFLEIETPMLVRPTPEGARDYLVPSRVHPGSFYALPQSPQLYKQILMVSGVDRYYQLARCLRDEDLRADRQPEHTQIDLEMSFVGEEDIHRLIEGLMTEIWRTQLQVTLELPFPRMTYREAMARFGSDKPDLRFGFELVDLSEIVRGCGFAIFEQAIESGGGVRGLVIPGGGSLSPVPVTGGPGSLSTVGGITVASSIAGWKWRKASRSDGPVSR